MHRNAEEQWERMRLSTVPGLYFLAAGFEKRMSTFAQQNRAISLVGYLLDANAMPRNVAIIGAGAAGTTAATLLAWRGVNVAIFDQAPAALSAYAGSSRFIHPRLYEWPRVDWNYDEAALPLMNWKAGTAREVTAQLRDQWLRWYQLFGPHSVHPRIRWCPGHRVVGLERHGDQFAVQCESASSHGPYDTVFFAIGPGRPLDPTSKIEDPETRALLKPVHWNYWDAPSRAEASSALVVGRGDSGLTWALERAVEVYDAGTWVALDQARLATMMSTFDRFLGSALNRLRTDLIRIDDELEEELQRASASPGPANARSAAELRAWRSLTECGSAAFNDFADGHLRKTPCAVTIAFHGRDALVQGMAFPLHRWLVAQLVRCGWLTLEPSRQVETLRHDQDGWFFAGDAPRYEVLFIGLNEKPPDPTGYIAKFENDLVQRGYAAGHGTVVLIGRQQRPEGRSGSRVFYSDLFDSTTQARVFEELNREHANESEAMQEFMHLYEVRLLLELHRRDEVLLGDNQVLDGPFFLRWLPRREPLLGSRGLLFTHRGQSIPPGDFESVRQAFFTRQSDGRFKAKPFEYSAVRDKADRQAINDALGMLDGEFDSPGSIENALRARLPARSYRAWEILKRHQATAIETLHAYPEHVRTWSGGMQLDAMMEDPAQFWLRLQREHQLPAWLRALVFDQIFVPNLEGRRPTRSDLYIIWDRLSDEPHRDMIAMVRDFYNRAYNRAIAEQNGATVFETVQLLALPSFTRSEADPRRTNPHRTLRQLVLEQITSDTLDGDEVRDARARQLPIMLRVSHPVVPAAAIDGIGARALALLRGSKRIERQWNEEALEVGARVPAVIDEEWIDDARLNRVEYRDGIAPI